MTNKYVAYVRTSTKDQELGLDAQEKKIRKLATQQGGTIVQVFSEHESGSNDQRPELHKAISFCEENDARLVIATLSRFARKLRFSVALRDSLESKNIKFTICDQPNATKVTLNILAVMDEEELDRIRTRTRDALAVIKQKIKEKGYHDTQKTERRITSLGNPKTIQQASENGVISRRKISKEYALKIMPTISDIENEGKMVVLESGKRVKAKVKTLSGIAERLNARGIKTIRGKIWKAQTVKNVKAIAWGSRV